MVLVSAAQQSESAMKVKVLVTQSCLILWDPKDFSPPGSSVHGILQARILERVATPYFREIFPVQGLNLGLLHCRQVLYCLIHQGHVLSLPPMPTPYSCLSIKLLIKKIFLIRDLVENENQWKLYKWYSQLIILKWLLIAVWGMDKRKHDEVTRMEVATTTP